MAFGALYPAYVKKVEARGRSRAELDAAICWLTGRNQTGLEQAVADGTSVRDFFEGAPAMNPARDLVTGVVCGVRVETLEDPLMRDVRILDKLVDEIAKGKAMTKVLRG